MTMSDIARTEVILHNEFILSFAGLDNECIHLIIKHIYEGPLHLRLYARKEDPKTYKSSWYLQELIVQRKDRQAIITNTVR